MKRCTICHATYPATFTHCPHDGSVLMEANEWTDGAVIRGKYRILSKLGQGGMASVYKALHMGFDEVRALKVIHAELAGDPSFVKRFAQEAALTRRLQHLNAVRVEDIDQADDGRPFIVMEFIEGQSLKDVIQKQAPLPVPRVCSIARQVAAALGAAHELGMIHRDIKPGNILLTRSAPDGEAKEIAKVLDFGIVKIKEAHLATGAATTLTRTGTSIGTPAYMSPEQAMGTTGAQLDGRADLYSLGVVMYEMLSGELPIQAESEVQMLIGQIHTAPQPIRARRPELPEGIGAVVMRCLEKDPARRPASGAALIALIEACETGVAAGTAPDDTPTVATPRAAAPRAGSVVPARRVHRWLWVTLLAVLVAGAGLWNVASRRKAVSKPPSVKTPLAVERQPSTESARPAAPPPAAPVPQQLPAKPPEAEPPAVPPAGLPPAAVQGSPNPAVDIQGLLNGLGLDAATNKQAGNIFRQANERMKKGDFDGAAAQYRKLERLRPGWAPAIAALTALATQKAAGGDTQNGARNGELAGAVARYSLAASLHPEVAANHHKLGVALGKLGDLDGDIREQQRALQLDPRMAVAHVELAAALARKQSWEEAAREYREAIRLKPGYADAHSGLGDALGHLGDWQGQIAEEQTALRRAPDLAIAHFRLAQALEKEGQTTEALHEYRRAAELAPAEAEFQANYQRLSRESQ